jgi:hypothetical protein
VSTTFLRDDIWPQVTRAVRKSKRPCQVAVAYLGRHGHQLLPLPRNSILVVDASEQTVKSGRTCPAALLTLINRGTRVYTAPNLHAKVFVIGRRAFVGSTNASQLSATNLIEAALTTSDAAAVANARKFVQSHCLRQLTPNVTKRLARIYNPPDIPGGGGRKKRTKLGARSKNLTGPLVRLVQLTRQEWSDADQAAHDRAAKIARKKRNHPKTYELDSFRWSGKCPVARNEIVIQVTDEGPGRIYVTPPGNVLHTAARRTKRGLISFVYLERPAYQRRKRLKVLAEHLGKGTQKKLRRSGLVRDPAFASSLLHAWHAP